MHFWDANSTKLQKCIVCTFDNVVAWQILRDALRYTLNQEIGYVTSRMHAGENKGLETVFANTVSAGGSVQRSVRMELLFVAVLTELATQSFFRKIHGAARLPKRRDPGLCAGPRNSVSRLGTPRLHYRTNNEETECLHWLLVHLGMRTAREVKKWKKSVHT